MTASAPSRPRVWNKRDPQVPADAVYVGRPTVWGNPFKVGVYGDRQACIDEYRRWILIERTKEQIRQCLRGKDLVCWCAPLPCHADVLLEIANAD